MPSIYVIAVVACEWVLGVCVCVSVCAIAATFENVLSFKRYAIIIQLEHCIGHKRKLMEFLINHKNNNNNTNSNNNK